MSYEIIRGLHIEEQNGEWVAVINSASSNCRPLYYSKFTAYKGKGLSKEELEKSILLDYFWGNIHGGNNKYNKFVNSVRLRGCNGFDRYNRLDKLEYDIYNRYRKASPDRLKEYKKLQSKLHDEKMSEAREVLYKLFKGE